MNKFLSIFLSIFILYNNVFAAEIIKPSFQEFCPPIYYHKEPLPEDWIESPKYTKGQKSLLWASAICFYPALFCYPMAISDTKWRRKQRAKKIREVYNETLKYWQEREKSFNDSLALCSSTKDIASCYIQVKLNEEQKTLAIEKNKILERIENGIYGIQAQQSSTNINLQQINNSINRPYIQKFSY